jgi:hypothetical protein
MSRRKNRAQSPWPLKKSRVVWQVERKAPIKGRRSVADAQKFAYGILPGKTYEVAGPTSQEAARRRRQIAAGRLKVENGLVL